MNEYMAIPVETARKLSRDFSKSIVIICAWDPAHKLLHTTTYGVEPTDKIAAAKGGDICAKALGMDMTQKDPVEDFRTVDAARNAQLRDLAPDIISTLREWSSNSANDLANKIDALITPK